MGLIKSFVSSVTGAVTGSATGAISGNLNDQWLDAYKPADMGQQTLMTYGTKTRASDTRNINTNGTSDIVSNGSKIQVFDNQMMMLVDGGRIVDYTAEPGYYTVDNSAMPSMLNGQFGDTLKDAFERFKFGGGTPKEQIVLYINLQEIKGVKYGTKNPVSYYDHQLDADLYIRAHGTYSIKVTDPILFYKEVMPRNSKQVEMSDVNTQFFTEFIGALQSSINQMSADGMSIRQVASQSGNLSKYMAKALDEDWRTMRGFEIQSVGMEVSYDEETRELLKTRSQGAMLKDANIREGFVQGAVARGMEAAGSNEGGAMAGFMGMGIGMQTGGISSFSATNGAQMQQQSQPPQQAQQSVVQPTNTWACVCGSAATGAFCSVCGAKKPEEKKEEMWNCECGNYTSGRFCSVCGKEKPAPVELNTWTCVCGKEVDGNFCSVCGQARPEEKKKVRCDKCGYEPEDGEVMKFCPECGDVVDENDQI